MQPQKKVIPFFIVQSHYWQHWTIFNEILRFQKTGSRFRQKFPIGRVTGQEHHQILRLGVQHRKSRNPLGGIFSMNTYTSHARSVQGMVMVGWGASHVCCALLSPSIFLACRENAWSCSKALQKLWQETKLGAFCDSSSVEVVQSSNWKDCKSPWDWIFPKFWNDTFQTVWDHHLVEKNRSMSNATWRIIPVSK